jgi:hypothetical protein
MPDLCNPMIAVEIDAAENLRCCDCADRPVFCGKNYDEDVYDQNEAIRIDEEWCLALVQSASEGSGGVAIEVFGETVVEAI